MSWRGLGRKPSFSKYGSITAGDDDRRPSILQLNTQGLNASNISVNPQLAYKNKALVVALQQTHCNTADMLMIPSFVAGLRNRM